MSITTLRAVGGSVMMAIPKSVLETLGLAANEKVELRIEGEQIIIRQRKKPKYRLDELLSQCDPNAAPHADAQAWDEAEPVGKEVI